MAIPTYDQWIEPILRLLHGHPNGVSAPAAHDAAARMLGLTDDDRAELPPGRRSAVRNMERRGLSRSVAMQLTGHKTEAVYRRYAITSDLRAGVERLNAMPISGARSRESA